MVLMHSQLRHHPAPRSRSVCSLLPVPLPGEPRLSPRFSVMWPLSLDLGTSSWKSPCTVRSVVTGGSALVDQEPSNGYLLGKSTPLTARSVSVAPLVNRKDFALFLSLESHLL